MNTLNVHIHNIKSIKDMTLNLPIDKGLYAIAGENATGKSTITMCAASLFYNFDVQQYLGRLANDSSITFSLNGQNQQCTFSSGPNIIKNGRINVKGFYDGSLVFGNRFRNTSSPTVRKLDEIADQDLEPADSFVRENLGLILCNDKSYYKDLYQLKRGWCRQ